MSLAESLYNNSPVFLQNMLISAFGYAWKNRRFGGVFPAAYKAAKERENFTSGQWLAYQNKELQKLLLHAFANVPYYQKSFSQQGITASVLKGFTIADLNKLPIVTKDNLRQFGTTTLISNVREPHGNFFASSGSTGTPTKILLSHAAHQRWFGIYEARVRNWAGVSSFIPRGMIGGRRIIADGAGKPPYYRYNLFEKQVYFSAYHINKNTAANYLQGINKYGVEYMTGYAMSNYFLAALFKELNLQARQLKAVVTSSEKLTTGMRQVFASVYNCKTYESWGSTESCGLVTECEHGGLHINEDAGIIELLNNDLQPAKPGEMGTVYCTGFLNYDQPLIRYRIGDNMVASNRSCDCGRQMQLVEEIVGRIEDVIIGKDGRKMVRFHGIFTYLKTIKQTQVIQETATDIVVKIVPDGRLDPHEAATIKNRIISQLGEMNVTIEEVNAIPISANGKYKSVVSKLKQ